MSFSPAIKQLLQNNQIWQASQKSSQYAALSTGYAELDQQLHYKGWPQGALSELLLANNGIGEIRLLAPLLAKLSLQPGYISWINPPYQPYAPALSRMSLRLEKMLLISTSNLKETIWAAQQAMTSGACSAVLVWLPAKELNKEIRKLSLAAQNGNCWATIIRPQILQQHASAAVLRIVMQLKQRQQQLSIIKQPGGWSGQQLSIDLFPERMHWNPLPAEHWPVFFPTKKAVKQDKLERQLVSHTDRHTLVQSISTSPSITTIPSYH